MKITIVAFLSTIAITSFAEQGQSPGGQDSSKFAERKAGHLAMLDQRIALLNQFRTCVSEAADHPAMVACREKHREGLAPLKMEMMERNESRRSRHR